jgi:ATP-dependent helicase/nuclease subunit B
MRERAIMPAEAVFLVPFAELLAPARRAFARSGDWMPRIHTTRTLTLSLGPARSAGAHEFTGEPGVDSLVASAMLRGQSWADAWRRRDRRGFEAGVEQLVRTTQMLVEGARAVLPAQRPAWWAQARGIAAPAGGPDAMERALLRTAIEWAAASADPDTDRLFGLRPGAWIALSLGGEDRLTALLLEQAGTRGVPALSLRADPEADDPFAVATGAAALEVVHAQDAEEEAWAAAIEVNAAIGRAECPVALIAEDRALVRRIRALLERTGTRIDDETGWSLATTRACAHAYSALRAARAAASPDERLDWLKSDLDDSDGAALDALELRWRDSGRMPAALRLDAEHLWARERARLEGFANPRRRPLAQWLQAFDRLLFDGSDVQSWQDDAAALQLRRVLRMDRIAGEPDVAWQSAAEVAMDLEQFSAWVDAVLESSRFVPPPRTGDAPVVLTPMSRAIGREFAAVVLPGADERRLGVGAPSATLLSQAALRALGLPDRIARQRHMALAFVHLLRVPRLVLTWRQADGDELLACSALLDRLVVHCRAHNLPPPQERPAALPLRAVAPAAVPRPMPTASGRLPESLSASAVELLRQCPYRFFARVVLHLAEQDELDDELDKRDYGRWLHATLERFHATREAPASRQAEVRRLRAVAERMRPLVLGDEPTRDAALLPHLAGLAAFAARYVDWMHAQDAEGWRFAAAELERQTGPVDALGLRLHGRIDRFDTHAARSATRVLDYKTSTRASLRKRVAQPSEDTQLAVYGALQLGRIEPGSELSACYLALDDSDGVAAVEHPHVADTARLLMRSLGEERRRIEAGAPLPALGEGRVCDTCEARGLCRRDHWAAQHRQAT